MGWHLHSHSWDALAVALADLPYHVLFLCTGNSARSILAECVLNGMGDGRFRAFSAGSHPKSAPHPAALSSVPEPNSLALLAIGDLMMLRRRTTR